METTESDSNKLCIACLCVGRSLKNFIDDKHRDFYVNALSEVPLYTASAVSPAICFECEALLKKAVAFREQVKDSYRILQTYTNESLVEFLISDVTRPPRLKIHNLEVVEVTPNITDINNGEVKNEIKNERNSLKNEVGENRNPTSEEDTRVKIELHESDESDNFNDYDDLTLKNEQDSEDTQSLMSLKTKKNNLNKKLRPILENDTARRKKKEQLKRKTVKSHKTKNILEINVDEVNLDIFQENDDCWVNSDSDNKNKVLKKELKLSKKEKKLKSITKSETKKKSKSENQISTIQLTLDELLKERESELEKDSYIKSEFKCLTCISVFSYGKSLECHNKSKHDQSLGEYVCTVCHTMMSSAESYTAHYNRHFRRYVCSICGFRSADVKVTKQHLLSAHRVVLKQYTCRLCDTVNDSLSSHRRHSERHRARVQCRDCDKTFSHRAGLMNHRLVVHESQNRFPCNLCDKVFQWKNSLKRHLEKHQSKSSFVSQGAYCSPCGITFAYVCSYKRHLKNSLKHVTRQELRFICDHCNRRFVDKTKLRDHIEEKHLNRTYLCNICNKCCKSRSQLDQHRRLSHSRRPLNKMCHHCGKGFPTKVQLESHIRTHTGERPFICELCPTTFTQQSNLCKHIRQVHQKANATARKGNER